MGRKFTLQRLEWTEENIELAIRAIKDSLHPKYLDRWQKDKYAESDPMAGHCHTAAGAFYMLFGPQYLELQRGPGIYNPNRFHFWCVRKDTGEIIDLTIEQYTAEGHQYDYSQGYKSQMLPYLKYYRAKEVYQTVFSQHAS